MWALPNLTKSFLNFWSFWAVPLILMFAKCIHQHERWGKNRILEVFCPPLILMFAQCNVSGSHRSTAHINGTRRQKLLKCIFRKIKIVAPMKFEKKKFLQFFPRPPKLHFRNDLFKKSLSTLFWIPPFSIRRILKWLLPFTYLKLTDWLKIKIFAKIDAEEFLERLFLSHQSSNCFLSTNL